jgi:hypothetical protein
VWNGTNGGGGGGSGGCGCGGGSKNRNLNLGKILPLENMSYLIMCLVRETIYI